MKYSWAEINIGCYSAVTFSFPFVKGKYFRIGDKGMLRDLFSVFLIAIGHGQGRENNPGIKKCVIE